MNCIFFNSGTFEKKFKKIVQKFKTIFNFFLINTSSLIKMYEIKK